MNTVQPASTDQSAAPSSIVEIPHNGDAGILTPFEVRIPEVGMPNNIIDPSHRTSQIREIADQAKGASLSIQGANCQEPIEDNESTHYSALNDY